MTARQVLVVALGDVRGPVLEAVTLARTLGTPTVLSLQPLAEPDLHALGTAGVERALVAELGDARHAAAVAGRAVATAAEVTGAHRVLLPTSFVAKEVAAHAAWLLDAGLLLDVASLAEDGDTDQVVGGKRVFAGTWETRCAVTCPVAVATVRANAVVATPADRAASTAAEPLQVDATLPRGLELLEREVRPTAGRPALAEAATVVLGGRGTEGDFAAVEELADVLGAAVGTTRDCVDEGWQPHDAQVGQTGVTIAPRLYIGAGISGAPHHHGGMQASGTIVAVNVDPDAPLVQIADFAVIGDLQEILPAAAAAIREHLDQSRGS
ncbi:electron transfer flavoprotein subunit alpha/FixB family protein [Pseudactinotalea suaedae]|uniref:electron transfer flavoprotein subunit alpha/FixB family protein n=1 Tax=Pseudactinotalea suaedae TaxID=1524924 RepID=UPI0012E31B9C|nr:electron transfer flavoprotein subunit alpha/FixB family protein [Pseudactinotalea suaedae]